MRLEFEILSEPRRGRVVTLDQDNPIPGRLPWVLETEAFRITLTTEESCEAASLVFDSVVIELSPDDESGRSFSILPQRSDRGMLKGLFYNYIGVAVCCVEVVQGTDRIFDEVGSVEVLAKKASAEQVHQMIDYILAIDEADQLHSKSPTRRRAGIDREFGERPIRLIEQLAEAVRILQDQTPYLVGSPISALKTRHEILDGAAVRDLGEEDITWLANNLSVLEDASDPENAVLKHQGRLYQAREIQSTVLHENTDLYENQIIHGYVDSLLRFVHQLLEGYQHEEKSLTLNHYDGYVSFFDVAQDWLSKKNQTHIARLKKLKSDILELQALMNRLIPVRKIDRSLPRFTPRVRSNRHYAVIFRAAHEWYQGAKIDWGFEQMLLSITNIPKLFELYCTLMVRQWLITRYGVGVGHRQSISSDSDLVWEGEVETGYLRMRYEPHYWMPGHGNHRGLIANTEIRTINRARTDGPGVRRTGEFLRRTPDISLEFTDSEQLLKVVVLDAKYTRQQLAFDNHLRDCTFKYVHGLGSTANRLLVQGVFILHPHEQTEYCDFHAQPFGVFGHHPQLPMLGILGLNMSDVETQLDGLLQRLILMTGN